MPLQVVIVTLKRTRYARSAASERPKPRLRGVQKENQPPQISSYLQPIINLVDHMRSSPVGPVSTCLCHCAGNGHLHDIVWPFENAPDKAGSGVPGQMTVARRRESVRSLLQKPKLEGWGLSLTKARHLGCPASTVSQCTVPAAPSARLCVVDSPDW